MKKLLIITLLFLTTTIFANIGQITALTGDIKIKRLSETLIPNLGFEIEKKDIISSNKNSKVQIVLKDETIITIGENSALNIEDYLYDDKNKEKSKASFNFFKGSFKSITGKIGKLNKEKFKLKTKSASIGIRGTTIVGNQSIIICTDGAITVTSNGVTVNVEKQEFTKIKKDTPPTKPQTVTEEILKVFTQEKIENEVKTTIPTDNENNVSSNTDTSSINDANNEEKQSSQSDEEVSSKFTTKEDTNKEFKVNYNNTSLAYSGEDISTPYLNSKNNSLLTYKEFKTLSSNTTSDGDGLYFVNTNNKEVMYIPNNFDTKGANTSYNTASLNQGNGSLTSSDDNLTGTIYGDTLQGLGASRIDNSTTIKSTAFLESLTTLDSNSQLQGYNSSIDTSSSAYTYASDTNIYTDFTNSSSVISTGVNIDTSLSNYYITDDIFAFKNNQSGNVISIPDDIDSSGNYIVSNDSSSWGYWNSSTFDEHSSWVAGVKNLGTTVSNLVALTTNLDDAVYNFNGHVIGAVVNNSTQAVDPILFDSNNIANFVLKFGVGRNNFTGNIAFNTESSQSWNTTINSGTLNAGNFTTTDITGSSITSATLDGTYFGDGSIESIGGGFKLNTASDTAIGVFKATKQ